MRESWLVEDRWWTDDPLRRRYWEVVTADGRDLVVFRDLVDGGGSRSADATRQAAEAVRVQLLS